jgi:hypothetical protein
MLVSDEKILLRAKEGSSPSEIYLAIQQVLTNCFQDKVDVSNLTLFDIEFLFIKLRSLSVNNKVTIQFTDKEDPKYPDEKLSVHNFNIDLEDVSIKGERDIPVLDIGSNKLMLKHPTGKIYATDAFTNADATASELFDELVVHCLDKYFVGETNTYDFKTIARAEVTDFISNLDIKTYNKIKDFIDNLPHVHYEVKYKDSAGKDKSLVLNSLFDFFSLV